MPRAIASNLILGLALVVAGVTVVGAVAVAPPAARAQPTPSHDDFDTDLSDARDRARAIAREAAELFQAGDRRAAIARFEEAYAIFPTPALLYNLGKAYAGVSDHVHAHRALTAFLRETAGTDVDADRRAEAEALLVELRRHVAVAPGVHEITARRDDLLVARKRLTFVGSGTLAIELVRVEDDLERVVITREVASRPLYKRWWFWSTIGAAVASGVALYIATNPRQVNEVASPPLGALGLDDFTLR